MTKSEDESKHLIVLSPLLSSPFHSMWCLGAGCTLNAVASIEHELKLAGRSTPLYTIRGIQGMDGIHSSSRSSTFVHFWLISIHFLWLSLEISIYTFVEQELFMHILSFLFFTDSTSSISQSWCGEKEERDIDQDAPEAMKTWETQTYKHTFNETTQTWRRKTLILN